jgi:hypothetical protein
MGGMRIRRKSPSRPSFCEFRVNAISDPKCYPQLLLQALKAKAYILNNVLNHRVRALNTRYQSGLLPAADFGFIGLPLVLGSVLVVLV